MLKRIFDKFMAACEKTGAQRAAHRLSAMGYHEAAKAVMRKTAHQGAE